MRDDSSQTSEYTAADVSEAVRTQHIQDSGAPGSFLESLELAPDLAERVRSGERSERFRGTADLPFFFRRPYGPGWALVGDAGYHKDPITAQGITDAFRDAELLAHAIDAGLDGRRPLDEALAEYERQRNEHVRPIFEFTHQLAGLEPPPVEMQELFGALRHDEDARRASSARSRAPCPFPSSSLRTTWRGSSGGPRS